MSDMRSNASEQGKKPFVKPGLYSFEVKGTETGPFPDPFEFPMILQQS